MTATPSRGQRPPRRGSGGNGENGGGAPYAAPYLDVIFERLDAVDQAIERMIGQVERLATQVSTLTATTQVLANTDTNFKQSADTQGAQIVAIQAKLYEFQLQMGEMKANIKQSITEALRETQKSERRADDRGFGDARQFQGYLVTALCVIIGCVLTYLFVHH